MPSSNHYAAHLSVGIVQTTIDASFAWQKTAKSPQMSRAQDDHVWVEICNALRAFQDDVDNPRLILMPELCLPRTRLNDFEGILGSLNALAVVGTDYNINYTDMSVRNEGLVFIPRNFFEDHPSRRCTRVRFGKTYPAPKEKQKLQNMSPPWHFKGDSNVYIFDAEQYGRFGVSICWDFMDVERALMYRGYVQHLFVIAYNKDLEMFRSLASSLSRTVFCNVVICNTGFYGGSFVVSPYKETHCRTIYGHSGPHLFTTQVVQLPVEALFNAQSNTGVLSESGFKDPPPGFTERTQLLRKSVNLNKG